MSPPLLSETLKVRFLKTLAGPDGTYAQGAVCELEAAEAARLMKAGMVEHAAPLPPSPAALRPVPVGHTRIRLAGIMAGPDGVFPAGSLVDLPSDRAEELIQSEQASRSDGSAAFRDPPDDDAAWTSEAPKKDGAGSHR